ncbi:tRNA-dependent cyclodipeptide synthase [Vibrio quintilis]|uniref:Cyclodipeptide synthase n=1 Tax=Vibrio quintilis TaxID=1117707 RepID=A0A1M7YTS6_9VIBR|nr:tRNA-dependent cyclodipeptide synthase [Vibrio quintilis]SHO55992.1 hypothetical protein VQ7734_01753 [Vibrio quintilis]
MNQQLQYKGEIQRVSPKMKRDFLKTRPKCFVGVSLSNPCFSGAKFEGLIRFIAARYNECTFLLGDHIHRLTLQITQGFGDTQAKEIALNMGQIYIQQHRHLWEKFYQDTTFNFIKGSDVYDDQRVTDYFIRIQATYNNYPDFTQAVNGFARTFISRALNDDELTEKAIALSSQYVLEELAETCLMVNEGHQVLVYPGSLAIFEKIADGNFSMLPQELGTLINVSVRLKKRKQVDFSLS